MNCSEKNTTKNYINFNLHADVNGFGISSFLSNNPGNSHNPLEFHTLNMTKINKKI